MMAPTKGVRSLAPLGGLGAEAAAFALALPDDAVFSHTTAARLWGLALPRRLEGETGLHVMRHSVRPPIERLGCVSHRGLERRETAVINGIPVTSLADTWLDVIGAFHARIFLEDAVMMGDAAVEMIQRTRFLDEVHPGADPASSEWWCDPHTRGIQTLRRRLAERRTFRGRRLAKESLRLVRPRVWSPMESYSRMVAVRAELPEPALNESVHFPDGGGLIGYGDLVWGKRKPSRSRVVAEYQGREVHTEAESSRADDSSRCTLMRDAGWIVIELYSKDITTVTGRGKFVHRLRRLL